VPRTTAPTFSEHW